MSEAKQSDSTDLLGPILAEWCGSAYVRFVSRSHGERTTDTVSRDSLLDLMRAVQAAERERWRALLADVSKQTRHPDYDWPACLQREVDEALGPNLSYTTELSYNTGNQ